MIKATILTWHTKEEKPHSKSGSFLILTDKGDIAEAEYSEQKGWHQYRWSVPNSHLDVVAWCPFSEIETPALSDGERENQRALARGMKASQLN